MDVLKNSLVTAAGGLWIVLSLVVTFRWSALRRLMRVNSLFSESRIVGNFSNMRDMFFHHDMNAKTDAPFELPVASAVMPESYSLRGTSQTLADWKAERQVTALLVLKDGKIAFEEYLQGTKTTDLRISWSMAKSLLSATFGIAVSNGLLRSLDDQVVDYVPSLKGSAYEGATVRNVLHMASGVEFNEDYLDFHSDINRMGRVLTLGGSMDDFAASLKIRAWEPGSFRRYVSIDTHVLGMVLRKITGVSVSDYMTVHLLRPMGIEADPYYLTDGLGTDFVLGGLNMRTRDYARFGLLYANNGYLNGRQIVPADWVAQSTTNSAPEAAPVVLDYDATLGYGFQWWLHPEATEGEFFALGIYGQMIYVNRPLKTVIAVNQADLKFRENLERNLTVMRKIAQTLA